VNSRPHRLGVGQNTRSQPRTVDTGRPSRAAIGRCPAPVALARNAVAFSAAYGSFESMADVLRQIGHDERVHKLGSIEAMRQPRFR
jgi:hypothetical protein